MHRETILMTGPAAIAPTEPATGSRRASVARRALQGAALLGILADLLLRDGLGGIGLLLWMLLFAGATIALARHSERALSRESWSWLVISVLCAVGVSLRDAELLQVVDVAAMLAALVLLIMSMDAVSLPALAAARVRDLIRAAFETGIDAAFGVVPLALRDAVAPPSARGAGPASGQRIGRAALIAAPVLFVFTLLLTRADPVFGSFLKFLDVDFDVLMSHILIAGFFTWIVGGWVRRAFVAENSMAELLDGPLPLTLGATDILLALGALNVLFLAYILVQVGSLFGGEAMVLKTTGLSYAQYARSGFLELTVVAGLLLALLLTAQALIPASDSQARRSYRRLAIPLILLLGAMMLSAAGKLKLYMHYYGISVDRLYAGAFMIWLAIVLAWFAATVLRSKPRAFAVGLVSSAYAILLLLNLMNPDALVARENLARLDVLYGGASAGADLRYVASLDGGAVPELVAVLTAPAVTVDTATPGDRCAAAALLLERWTGERSVRMAGHWTQWNLARSRAIEAVRAQEGELRRRACAKTAPAVKGS